MGADVIASGGGGNVLGAIGNIGGALLNYGIGSKRNSCGCEYYQSESEHGYRSFQPPEISPRSIPCCSI